MSGRTRPRRRPARRPRVAWFLVALVLAFGAGGAVRRIHDKLVAPPPPTPVAHATPRAPRKPAPPPAPSATPSATASAVSAPAAPPTQGELLTCVTGLLPDGTFQKPEVVDFTFLCREADARAGTQLMEHQIVAARGAGVTDGMKAWATMSWYKMAAFAVAREHCCRGTATPLAALPGATGCAPLDASLSALGRASAADQQRALDDYTRAVDCLVHTAVAKILRVPDGAGGRQQRGAREAAGANYARFFTMTLVASIVAAALVLAGLIVTLVLVLVKKLAPADFASRLSASGLAPDAVAPATVGAFTRGALFHRSRGRVEILVQQRVPYGCPRRGRRARRGGGADRDSSRASGARCSGRVGMPCSRTTGVPTAASRGTPAAGVAEVERTVPGPGGGCFASRYGTWRSRSTSSVRDATPSFR